MITQNIQNWDSDKNLDGLLFFSQLIDEMLFDYTMDSYKQPVYNTHSLFDELLNFINNTEADYILENNSGAILEELIENLRHDAIAKKVLGHYFEKILSFFELQHNLDPKKREYDKIFSECEIAINFLNKSYLPEIKVQLVKYVKNPREKKVIKDLTKKLLSELIYWGYSKQYIYHENQLYFFKDNKIKTFDQISDFLNKFSFEIHSWEVFFKGNREFEKLKDISVDVAFKIEKIAPNPRTKNPSEFSFFETSEEYPFYLIFEEIFAYDPFQARLFAEQYYYSIINLARYKIHTSSFDWNTENVLCYRKGTERFWTPNLPASPLGKIRYPALNDDQYGLNKFSRILHNLDVDSVYAFMNSLNLHNCAIQSATDSNQFINMWIAMETLLSTNNSKKRGISRINETYIPVLGKDYINKLIQELLRSLKINLTRTDLAEIFSEFPFDVDEIEKCAMLLLQGNETILKKLLEKIGRNPLLIFKIHQLTENFKNAEQIKKTILMHNQRIEWHLFRIYRTRNDIVHKGEKVKPILINQLLENIHYYYHVTIDLIESTRAYYNYSNYINTFESIFNLIKFQHEMHIQYLKNSKGEICNNENYKNMLFGRI